MTVEELEARNRVSPSLYQTISNAVNQNLNAEVCVVLPSPVREEAWVVWHRSEPFSEFGIHSTYTKFDGVDPIQTMLSGGDYLAAEFNRFTDVLAAAIKRAGLAS